ncbi:MAG: hypothetical protein RLZZ324_906 [Candidatus Parcubacteria bacterium]|jgi:hypothetical protein
MSTVCRMTVARRKSGPLRGPLLRLYADYFHIASTAAQTIIATKR